MKFARFSLAWVLALLGAHAALLAQTEGESSQGRRSALRAERERQTLGFDAAERACFERFFTSNCLGEVARSRRAMLADIKRQEAALDAADRQQRAQEELQQLKEKQQAHEAQLLAIDPAAIEKAQREKQTERDDKLREHAAKAAPAPSGGPSGAASDAPASPQPSPARAPKLQTGPSDQERAANQAAFEKKQAQAQRRVTEREQARAKAAASAASAPRSLPVPVQ